MALEVQPRPPAPVAAARLHRKLAALEQDGYDLVACERYAAEIDEINRLKAERRAVILAHNYQRPEIFEVASLSATRSNWQQGARSRRRGLIVFCGVHFMAETAKVFNPERKVLIPDLRAGCSLAESVTAEALADRRDELRELYPDLKIVSYVNCTADVKALSDACCTSANARKWSTRSTRSTSCSCPTRISPTTCRRRAAKQIISWDGNCYVHHQITADEVDKVKHGFPD